MLRMGPLNCWKKELFHNFLIFCTCDSRSVRFPKKVKGRKKPVQISDSRGKAKHDGLKAAEQGCIILFSRRAVFLRGRLLISAVSDTTTSKTRPFKACHDPVNPDPERSRQLTVGVGGVRSGEISPPQTLQQLSDSHCQPPSHMTQNRWNAASAARKKDKAAGDGNESRGEKKVRRHYKRKETGESRSDTKAGPLIILLLSCLAVGSEDAVW